MSAPTNSLIDSLFAHAGVGLCLLDASACVERANELWLNEAGLTLDEVMGRSIWELFPDVHAATRSLLEEARTTGQTRSLPVRDASNDQLDVWCDGTIEPVALPSGTGVLLALSTRPNRGPRGSIVSKTQGRSEAVLDALVEGCRILDHSFRYRYVNAAVLRQTKKTAEDFLGRTIFEVFPQLAGTPICKALERSMAARVPSRIEHELKLPDGSTAWFDLSVQPIDEGLFVLSVDITEKKRAEMALRTVRDELQAIFRASPVAFAALDNEGKVLLWSAACERLFGWRESEIVGRPLLNVPDEKLDEVRAVRARVRAGETIRDLRTLRVSRDGRRIPMSLSCAPLIDVDGAPKGIVAVMIDLSNEEALRVALNESELRYATVFDASPMAKVLIRARDRQVVDINPTALQMFGLTRDEALAPGAVIRMGNGSEEARAELWASLRRGERVSRYELGYSSPNEPLGEAELSASLITLGGEIHALVSVYDVTARKRAERALHESDERFRQIAETIDEVFWLTDPAKGEIVYINPAYERIWGRSREALYANPTAWVDAIHPADRDRVRVAAMTQQTKGSYDEEYRVVRGDGTIRWIRDRAYPVRNSAGEVVRVAGAAQDITEQRDLEQQLRQTQKMESVGQLAGGVAHDFNNMLMVIEGARESLAEIVGHDAACAELLDEIHLGYKRAASLTSQLLAFSRRDVIEPRVIVIEELIRDTEKMLRRILGEDIALSLSFAKVWSRVKVDTGSWVQVLMNLAVNARDAMPRGGRLEIATERVTIDESSSLKRGGLPAGEYVRLRVVDTGVGMSAEVQARVFEPFFTTKDVGKGTGLGLSVVHGIVTQSGGYIELTSEPGLGTTFVLHVPLADVDPPVVAEEKRNGLESGNETILLVEDEDSIRRLAYRALSRVGYNVIEAADGRQAIEVATRYRGSIHLLVTDVVMPNLDGRSLAEALISTHPETLVLFTSGYTDDMVLRYGVQHAEVPFLAKPYALSALRQRVREVLDSRTE